MPSDTATDAQVAEVLASIQTESGASLLALAEASPVLLVFLRHFGCSFCRQTINQVADVKGELDKRGVRPVFVHLGPPHIAKANFDYYGLNDVERINDPLAAIYQNPVFSLSRSNPYSHFTKVKVLTGWLKGALFKYGIGKIEGDGYQMPGIFFLKGPRIVRKFVHRTIADEPDYLRLVE